MEKMTYKNGISLLTQLVATTSLPEFPTKRQFKSYKYNEAYKLKAVYMLLTTIKKTKYTTADFAKIADAISPYMTPKNVKIAYENFFNYVLIDRRRTSIGRKKPATSKFLKQLQASENFVKGKYDKQKYWALKYYDLDTIKNYLHEWFFTPIRTHTFIDKYQISYDEFYRWLKNLNLSGRIYYYKDRDKNQKKYKTILNYNDQEKIDLFKLAKITKMTDRRRMPCLILKVTGDAYTTAAYEEFIAKLDRALR